MGSTSRLNLPYPESSAANDVPKDIKALADALAPILAADYQGLLSARPAAGVRGRYYWATDDSLFRDNGSAWVRVTPGTWKTWTPTITVLAPAPSSTDFLVFSVPTYQYRLLPGNFVEFEIDCQAKLFGLQQALGVKYTLPVTQADTVERAQMADCFNDIARAVVLNNGLEVYPTGGYASNAVLADMAVNNRTAAQTYSAYPTVRPGQWPVDGTYRRFRVRGTYAI
jgi:hypothetical protein